MSGIEVLQNPKKRIICSFLSLNRCTEKEPTAKQPRNPGGLNSEHLFERHQSIAVVE